jgi:hypothetical protein
MTDEVGESKLMKRKRMKNPSSERWLTTANEYLVERYGLR